jgi:hypothetical protein
VGGRERVVGEYLSLLNFDNTISYFFKETLIIQHMIQSVLKLFKTLIFVLLFQNDRILNFDFDVKYLSKLVHFMILHEYLFTERGKEPVDLCLESRHLLSALLRNMLLVFNCLPHHFFRFHLGLLCTL